MELRSAPDGTFWFKLTAPLPSTLTQGNQRIIKGFDRYVPAGGVGLTQQPNPTNALSTDTLIKNKTIKIYDPAHPDSTPQDFNLKDLIISVMNQQKD